MRPSLVHRMALLACLLGMRSAAAQFEPAQRPPTTPPVKQAPLFITAATDVVIPFKVRATDAQGRPPALVRIYVSLDQGQGWQVYQEVKPAEESFRFRAKPSLSCGSWSRSRIVLSRLSRMRLDTCFLALALGNDR